jgi:hypothetical protein
VNGETNRRQVDSEKTKLKSHGLTTTVYIQLHAGFEVQLESETVYENTRQTIFIQVESYLKPQH